MYLPKITNKTPSKKAPKVLPKLTKPTNSRELVETNNIAVTSKRRLAAKHRSRVKPLTVTAVAQKAMAMVDTPPTPTQNIDEVLEVIEEAVVETAPLEDIAEETESVEEQLDLESMTKKQLIEVAKQEKVTYKNLTKPELLEALTIVLG